jgi:hypothetical protein
MKCRLCRTRDANSREHVFPSAIGGRWSARGVLCKPCNERCGSGIDAALNRSFVDMVIVLGIEGDHGSTRVEKVDDQGRRLIVEPGMVPRLAEGPPQIASEDGVHQTVTVTSERSAQALIASHARKGRTFTVNSASVRTSYPGRVPMEVAFQGEDAFRSSCKTVLTFIATTGKEGAADALRGAWTYVGGAERTVGGVDIAFAASPGPVPGTALGLGSVSHRVAVRSNGSGFIEADVRFFGEFGICARIATPDLTHPFCIGYGIDPLTRRHERFDHWTGAIEVPGAAPAANVEAAMKRAIFAAAQVGEERNNDRARRDLIERAVHEAFAEVPEGAMVTEEAHRKFASHVAERVTRMMFRIDSVAPAPDLVEPLNSSGSKKDPEQK